MPVIHKQIFIDAPVEEVFKIGWDPNMWEQWYVGLSGPDIMHGDGEAGSVVELNYTVIGINFPIITKVIEVIRSPEKSVWTGTFEGGIVGGQTFTYTKEGDGTRVEAHVDYTMPGKILGKIGNSRIVEKIQENAIEHSLSNMKLLAEMHD